MSESESARTRAGLYVGVRRAESAGPPSGWRQRRLPVPAWQSPGRPGRPGGRRAASGSNSRVRLTKTDHDDESTRSGDHWHRGAGRGVHHDISRDETLVFFFSAPRYIYRKSL
jgi:hypothetical protein